MRMNDGMTLAMQYVAGLGAIAWQAGIEDRDAPRFKSLYNTVAWWDGWERARAEFYPEAV
jgi:hypothetical protein